MFWWGLLTGFVGLPVLITVGLIIVGRLMDR